jgi:hypothetical protein
MVNTKKVDIPAELNQVSAAHPKWSHITVYRPKSESTEIPGGCSNVPTLAVQPVPWDDMTAMMNCGGDQKGIAIALGAVPYVTLFSRQLLIKSPELTCFINLQILGVQPSIPLRQSFQILLPDICR